MNKYFIFFMILFFILMIHSTLADDLPRAKIIQIATDEFNKIIPIEYQSNYEMSVVERLQTSYYIKWIRKINSIPDYNDYFLVRIYPDSGDIVNTEYHYSGSINISTISTITSDQAKWIINQAYNGAFTKDTIRAILDAKLDWRTQMRLPSGLIWVDIDANTGETVHFD